jgi:hypothetical protein
MALPVRADPNRTAEKPRAKMLREPDDGTGVMRLRAPGTVDAREGASEYQFVVRAAK